MDSIEIEHKWLAEWENTWRPLLLTDGKLDETKIKNELHDLWFIYEQVGRVYMSITGGRLSKPMYYADVIIDFHKEACQRSYEDGLSEGKAEALLLVNPTRTHDSPPTACETHRIIDTGRYGSLGWDFPEGILVKADLATCRTIAAYLNDYYPGCEGLYGVEGDDDYIYP